MIYANIESAYLHAFTCESVHTISGPEFGPKWEGTMLIILKEMNGLKPIGGIWSLKLSDNLMNTRMRPFEADLDLWMHPWMNNNEYIAVVTDDLLLFTKNSVGILEPLKNYFGMK